MCYNRIMSTEHSTTNSGQRAAQTREKIVDRVRKLLNLAANDAAAEGEIRNAMKAASKLIAQYQIEKTELEAAAEEVESTTYAKDFASFGSSRGAPWMGVLAMAVARAVGSVQVYASREGIKKGAFDRVEVESGVVFYGPDSDVLLAKEVFAEWLLVIATISVGRYGGSFRGEGREYAIGFATSLYEIAKDLYKPKPEALPGSSSRAIVPVESALAKKREEGSAWLRSQGVNLGGVGKSYSVRSGSGAYSQGRADGRSSGFGVSRTKSLGGGR